MGQARSWDPSPTDPARPYSPLTIRLPVSDTSKAWEASSSLTSSATVPAEEEGGSAEQA
jgi:hypothetical protein